jgi:hypothetical protein
MRTLLIVILVGTMGVAAAADRRSVRGGASPRATDLLRAEEAAEGAAKRLRLPPKRGAGWKPGGVRWGARARAEPPPAAGAVTIKVAPPRRRPTR